MCRHITYQLITFPASYVLFNVLIRPGSSKACWCEKMSDTMERTMESKANAISAAKGLIIKTKTLIKELMGEITSHGAEIEQAKKDMAQNKNATKEAEVIRNKENKEHMDDRTGLEQYIGAVQAAIKVLTGSGGKRKKRADFFKNKEATLISIVVGLKIALKHKAVSMSHKDLEAMQQFANPGRLLGRTLLVCVLWWVAGGRVRMWVGVDGSSGWG